MKKLSFKEKVMNMAQMKQLQQEVQALCDQEQTREADVEAHQSKATQITALIQLVPQKLQHIAQSIEAGPSKHISFDRVEQLVAQVEEVTREVAKVQQMLKEFQEKVGPPTYPGLEPELEA